MVQSAEDRRGDQFGGAGDRSIGLGLGKRRVAGQALVRPGRMVIFLDEFPQQPLQMALPQDDHVIQKLSAQGSDEPLDERVLPGTPIGGPHVLDVAGLKELLHAIAIDPVIIPEDESRLLALAAR